MISFHYLKCHKDEKDENAPKAPKDEKYVFSNKLVDITKKKKI